MDSFFTQLLEVLTISSYILLIVGPLLVCVAFLTYLERKVIAAVQYRKGPNVVGMFGSVSYTHLTLPTILRV